MGQAFLLLFSAIRASRLVSSVTRRRLHELPHDDRASLLRDGRLVPAGRLLERRHVPHPIPVEPLDAVARQDCLILREHVHVPGLLLDGPRHIRPRDLPFIEETGRTTAGSSTSGWRHADSSFPALDPFGTFTPQTAARRSHPSCLP